MSFMKELLLKEMESYLGDDQKRINHAHRVLKYAEQILEKERGDRKVVEAAAILHDIGIHEAEKKYGSTAGKYQEIEGPPIAKNILAKLGFPANKIDEVLEIIAHHHSGGVDTDNFKIIWDADWLVNLQEDLKELDQDKKKRLVEKNIMTEIGKSIALKDVI